MVQNRLPRNPEQDVALHREGEASLKLFEIQVPLKSNLGKEYSKQIYRFEEYLLKHTGGFNQRPWVTGQWMSANGQVYKDMMLPYHIACDEKVMKLILRKAFELFPDQLGLYVAEIGQAFIIPNPELSKEPRKCLR